MRKNKKPIPTFKLDKDEDAIVYSNAGYMPRTLIFKSKDMSKMANAMANAMMAVGIEARVKIGIPEPLEKEKPKKTILDTPIPTES